MRNDDDDDFETLPNGKRILKDGRILRVPATLMDGIHPRVAALHRPGYAVTSAVHDTQRQRVLDARAEYIDRLTNAWRGDAGNEGSVVGAVCTVRNAYPDYQGAPGHLRRVRGHLICVPDELSDETVEEISHQSSTHHESAVRIVGRSVAQQMRNHSQIMDAEYAVYDENLRRAFRGGGRC